MCHWCHSCHWRRALCVVPGYERLFSDKPAPGAGSSFRQRGSDAGLPKLTLGELRLGVLQAPGPEAAARRLSTYQLAQRFEPLSVDERVSEAWALLVSKLRAAHLREPINDSWIAATAVAHQIPIATQDGDYSAVPDVEVITL
ncbi:PIN domain-containing protein [Mycobacterium kansasii]